MTHTSTSSTRIDELIAQSDLLYDAIDATFDGEVRYRRMLRRGINLIAKSLNDDVSIDEIGAQLLAIPFDNPKQEGALDTLANQYADVKRATLDREGNDETDARHAVHLMHIASSYAKLYYPQLNAYKVAAYALVHDLVEAYSDDVSSLGITPEREAQKNRDEAAALEEINKDYGDEWPGLLKLIYDYEALIDAEARFTKTFDKLDPGFTHFYSKGEQLKNHYGFDEVRFYEAISQTTTRMSKYSSEFPLLMEDRLELTDRVASAAFKNAA